MMKKISIFGDGGHAQVIKDIANLNGYEIQAIFDDKYKVETVVNNILLANIKTGYTFVKDNETAIFIAIGSSAIRSKIARELALDSEKIINLIHPNVIISPSVIMGIGNVLMPGAIINAEANLGDFCIVNTAASVDHNCTVGHYSHISAGARICGDVRIDNNVEIGAGAIVIPRVHIRDEAIIGAGTVVLKDVEKGTVIVGNPGKQIK